MRVLFVNDLLDGGGHKDVALLVQHILSLVRLGAGEAHDGAVVDPVVFQGLEQSTIRLPSYEILIKCVPIKRKKNWQDQP